MTTVQFIIVFHFNAIMKWQVFSIPIRKPTLIFDVVYLGLRNKMRKMLLTNFALYKKNGVYQEKVAIRKDLSQDFLVWKNVLISLLIINNNYKIGMSELLLELVLKEDPELFEKYVNKYLPDDPDDLERIYNELQSFRIKTQKSQQKQDFKEIKRRKNTISYSEKNSQEYMARQSRGLMVNLRDKGIRPNHEVEEGLDIFESQKERKVKPLKVNEQLRYMKKGNIERLLKNYELNKKYYSSQFQEAETNFDKIHDLDMKKFLERRKTLLNYIKEKRNINLKDPYKTLKFSSMPSRVFKSTTKTVAVNSLPVFEKPKKKLSFTNEKHEIGQLIEDCSKQLKKKEPRRLKGNFFDDLEKKLELNYNEKEEINKAMEIKVRQNLNKEQYERYTNTYMKTVVVSNKFRSKKLPNHSKQLLKDELRLRKLFQHTK